MLRVFRSIIPDFTTGLPPASTAAAIREYISSDVVKACITSIHEPYFVDLQKEFASLIATVLVTYNDFTKTARDVLLSLPNVKQADVDSGIEYMMRKETSSRGQRAVVLQLLGDIKGVSVSEMGKLSKSTRMPTKAPSAKRPSRSRMAQQFMTVPSHDASRPGATSNDRENGNGDNLEGLASLFDS